MDLRESNRNFLTEMLSHFNIARLFIAKLIDYAGIR